MLKKKKRPDHQRNSPSANYIQYVHIIMSSLQTMIVCGIISMDCNYVKQSEQIVRGGSYSHSSAEEGA